MKQSAALVLLGIWGLSLAEGFVIPGAPSSRAMARASAGVERSSQSTVRMSETKSFLSDPMLKPLEDDDYVSIGLACCYVMNENNKLDEYYVLEPLTAGTLETIEKGVETSYKRVTALKAVDVFKGNPQEPTGIKVDNLQLLLKGEEATICEDMVERTLAGARTFKRRVEAQLVGFGEIAEDYNFNTNRKRILNHKYEPSFDDNVKQDKSIDVYGREEEGAEQAKQIAELENI